MYDLNNISEEFTKSLNENVKNFYVGNHILIYQKYFDFRVSYLAPAYHFNRLEKVIKEYFENDIKVLLDKSVVDENDMCFSTLKIQLELNAFLIALKTGLDRLVFFVSKTHRSVMPSSTFGRINVLNGKAKGMMSEVIKRKDSDKLMKLIFENYNDWISKAVKPRDTVIHYENLSISFRIKEDNTFSPVFNKLEKNIDSFELLDLKEFVDKWFSFSKDFIHIYGELLNENARSKDV